MIIEWFVWLHVFLDYYDCYWCDWCSLRYSAVYCYFVLLFKLLFFFVGFNGNDLRLYLVHLTLLISLHHKEGFKVFENDNLNAVNEVSGQNIRTHQAPQSYEVFWIYCPYNQHPVSFWKNESLVLRDCVLRIFDSFHDHNSHLYELKILTPRNLLDYVY